MAAGQEDQIGTKPQGGEKIVNGDVLIGGTPFVKSGDCADPEIRDNHARALVTALELGSKSTQMLARLDENMRQHQDQVCRKLEDIRIDLKDVTQRLIKGDQQLALMARDVEESKKDINGLGTKVRDHVENHADCTTVENNFKKLEKHLDWHEHQRELAEERRHQLFRDIRTPVFRWVLVGSLGLAVLGAMISTGMMIIKVVPVLNMLEHI
ncbi:MAG: hypothetical protein ACWGQW_25785, partial [bacterium]